jgi:hypothetical protein
MSAKPLLEIIVKLLSEKCPQDKFEKFRTELDKALISADYGSCGSQQSPSSSSGYLQFSCSMSNLPDGLNLLREHCHTLNPNPQIQVTLYDQNHRPIRIFPNNDLLEYLSGLE